MTFHLVRILLQVVDGFELAGAWRLFIMLMPVYMFSIAVTFNISKW